jgi:hypothetical protein
MAGSPPARDKRRRSGGSQKGVEAQKPVVHIQQVLPLTLFALKFPIASGESQLDENHSSAGSER